MANCHEKYYMSYSVGESQVKTIDITMHLLEWPISVTLTSNVGKDVEQKECSSIVAENVKRHSRFGRQYGYMLQNSTLTIQSSNRAP